MDHPIQEYHRAHQLRPPKPMPDHTYYRTAVAAAKLHANIMCDRAAKQSAKQPVQRAAFAAQLKWLMSNEEHADNDEAGYDDQDSASIAIRGGYRRAASAEDAQEAYRAALHRFKVDNIIEQTEAQEEEVQKEEALKQDRVRRSRRKVTYSLSTRGLMLARTAKAEYCLTADDLALLDVTVVGGGRLFDIRRERRYYNPDDLKALAERKHGARGLARKQAEEPALDSLFSPNAGKRKRTRSEVEGGCVDVEVQPVRRSARLIDMLPAPGSHFIAEWY